MLKVSNVSKKYGDFVAVDSLSFAAERGKIYGLIGPNGAGKSTTIRMIMGILAPDSGLIELDGKPFAEEDRNRIGYLPEERGLYKKQKLNDVLLYLAAIKGCPAREAQRNIDHWLNRFGLAEWKSKKIDSLSKGMAQKAQFIATVAHDPDLVFLDEPFSGLDPVSADELLAVIRELESRGKLVFFSTHVMEQSEKVCDRIIMLDRGTKLLDGDLREIRKTRGRNTVSIQFEAAEDVADSNAACMSGEALLKSLAPVEAVRNDGGAFIAKLAGGAQPDDLFVALAGKAKVRSFTVNETSLHDIFVELVKGNGAR